MNVRRLALGLLLTAVLAATGCFNHCDKCADQPKCCPPPPPPPPGVRVVPAPPPGPPPGVQYYYGPPVYGR